MNFIFKFAAFVLLTGVLFNLSCKKEHSCENCIYGNKPPIANAGPDQLITLPTDSISLDGNASNDPDGKISEWLWTKISGPASFTIIKPTDSTTKVKTLVAGNYQFELKVKDNGGLYSKDTMQIFVNDPTLQNAPPVANAGPDQTILLPINKVNLDGSGSTDPDNNIVNYEWTKISGPASFSITNPNLRQTQITNLIQGSYQFELKVTDAGGLISKDTMEVAAYPTLPDPCAVNRPIINAQLVPFGTLSQGCGPVAVASAGNKILFAGGFSCGPDAPNPIGGEATSRVDIYDIVTHTWSKAELSVARWDMAVAVSGNKIFFAGGADTDELTFSISYANIDIYDASTNTWSLDSLSSPRHGVVGASVGDKVFFTGGFSSPSTDPLNVIDIYDVSKNSWTVTTFANAKAGFSAVSLNNKIYFAGGTGNNTISKGIDIYDNATSSWSVNSLLEPKVSLAGIAFGDKIYWAGGRNSFATTSSQVEIRNVATNISTQACLFQPNSNFSAVSANNKIIFFTGNEAPKNKFDIYDVTTNTWSIGVLNENISGASIISVHNIIYVAGGNVNNNQFSNIWKLEF